MRPLNSRTLETLRDAHKCSESAVRGVPTFKSLWKAMSPAGGTLLPHIAFPFEQPNKKAGQSSMNAGYVLVQERHRV